MYPIPGLAIFLLLPSSGSCILRPHCNQIWKGGSPNVSLNFASSPAFALASTRKESAGRCRLLCCLRKLSERVGSIPYLMVTIRASLRQIYFFRRIALPSHPHVTRSHSDTHSLLHKICVLPFSSEISCRISIFRTSKSNFALRQGLAKGNCGGTVYHFAANETSSNIICFRSAHIIAPLFIGRPTSSLHSSTFRSSIIPFPIMDPAAHISADSENGQHENVCTLPARISKNKISILPQKQRRPFTHLQSGTQIPELHEALSTPRGALVVVEGLDRSGKSTQCEQLVDYLKSQGKQVQHIKFPDRNTATGKSLDAYLKNALELGDLAVHKIFFQNRLEKM